jgi:hypothetical protein
VTQPPAADAADTDADDDSGSGSSSGSGSDGCGDGSGKVRPSVVSIGGDRPRNWLLLIVSAWVAVLLAGIGWAVVHGRPTDREQTTVAAALPYVDAAASRIAATAEADGQAVSVVSGFDKVGDCKVSLVRPGQRFQRVVTVLVAPGTEGAAFQRIAARLPASYKVTVRTAPLPSLVGDAGLFVRIVGNKAGDGVLRIALDTGSCRSLGPLLVPTPPPGNRSAVAPAFQRLGLAPVQTMVFAVPCTRGPGQLSTVESFGPDNQVAVASHLPSTLDGLGTPIVSSPQLYAYRSGDATVGVRVEDNRVVVSATSGCAS